ncbi:MAG: DUF933 domain-containing protein, partial [Flammeovirgaceae bacterium]|nr:DUF933 domain-containing protein [Flammeovirgaceae bacterium]
RVNPVEDKEIIDTELQLKDLESVEKKISKYQKAAQAGIAEAKKMYEGLLKFKNRLLEGKNVRGIDATEEEWETVKDLFLLTAKPVIYVANVEEASIHTGNEHVEALKNAVKHENAEVIVVCAALEAQIAAFDNEEDRKLFLQEYGLKESGLNKLIRASYALLNLITYFTAGEKEVRAWTIQKGWKAPKAAGVIHSDFERGFIRAEVIKYHDFVHYKSELACKEAGKLSIEGKDYVVEDGDIMHFRFNV